MADAMKRVGARIRHYRKRAGMTQQQLAERAHVAVMTLRRYEQGYIVKTELLADIAVALGVRALDLMFDSPTVAAAEMEAEGTLASSPEGPTLSLKGLGDPGLGGDVATLLKELRDLAPDQRRTVIAHLRGLVAGMKLRG